MSEILGQTACVHQPVFPLAEQHAEPVNGVRSLTARRANALSVAGAGDRPSSDATEQAPVLRRLEGPNALGAQTANEQDSGQRIVVPHLTDLPAVSASANGSTGPEPA